MRVEPKSYLIPPVKKQGKSNKLYNKKDFKIVLDSLELGTHNEKQKGSEAKKS